MAHKVTEESKSNVVINICKCGAKVERRNLRTVATCFDCKTARKNKATYDRYRRLKALRQKK